MVPRLVPPCLPSPAERPPSGPGWVHEIKHDGFRMMVRRDAVGVRLLTRNGHDWSDRYPAIVEAVNRLKARSCLIDGEAVVCDEKGLAVFELLRRKHGAFGAGVCVRTSTWLKMMISKKRCSRSICGTS
jgi:ATP-dependent DNA ligase